MKTLARPSAALITLLAAITLTTSPTASLRAQTQRKPSVNSDPKPAPVPSDPVYVASPPHSPADNGDVTGQVYTNNYFGMKLAFPEGWFVFNDVGKAEAMERSKSVIIPKSATEQQMLEQSRARTSQLLYVKQYLDASPERPSGMLLVISELLPVMNITPVQYAGITKNLMLTRSTIKIEPVGDIATERLAGEEFALLTVKIDLPSGHKATQEYHFTIRRGWALAFILTYESEQQHATLTESLNSLAFVKPVK